MYRFSRSIYRETQAHVVATECADAGENRQQLRDACEAAIRRLTTDRRHFARPARTLFRQVRTLFPLCRQEAVYRTIERHMALAQQHLENLEAEGVVLEGQVMQCEAHTRQGTPCRRKPVPGSDFCPSHRHLEAVFEIEIPLPAGRSGGEQLQTAGAAA